MAFCDDGVVRIIHKSLESLTIVYSLRLHDEPILYGAISSDGTYLATVTKQQLFFSKIKVSDPVHAGDSGDGLKARSIDPIGFVLLKHELSRMYWSENSKMLYSFCGHDIVCYPTPSDDEIDSSSSFEIEIEPTVIAFTPFR